LHGLAGPCPPKERREEQHAEERAPDHDELLRHEHDFAEDDGITAQEWGEGDVIPLPSPDLAGQSFQDKGEADRGQHQADGRRVHQRAIGEPLGEHTESE